MDKDNGTLTVRDQQNRNVDSSEQYAINALGDGAIKSVDRLVKAGKRIAESSSPRQTGKPQSRRKLNRAASVQCPAPVESPTPIVYTQPGVNQGSPLAIQEQLSVTMEQIAYQIKGRQTNSVQTGHEYLSKGNPSTGYSPSSNDMKIADVREIVDNALEITPDISLTHHDLDSSLNHSPREVFEQEPQVVTKTVDLPKTNEIARTSISKPPADIEIPYPVQSPKMTTHRDESTPTSVSAKQRRPTPRNTSFRSNEPTKKSINSSAPQESHLQLKTEAKLYTWAGNPSASNVQNQGRALAIAEDSGAALHSAQAAGEAVGQTAGSAGASAAANAAAPGVAAAIQATEKAVTKIKETVENIAVSSPKRSSTVGALAALFLLPLLVIAAIAGAFRGGGAARNVGLSADVIALMPQISAACQANGIPEYAQLVAAVIMQESGGRVAEVGGDVMQCAESLGYPAGTPIPVEESINHGVGVLAHKLSTAGAAGPTDIAGISLALQAYNYGDGYFSWARSHGGGYSKENALSFQQYQMAHGYPGGYGDANYVDHVFRYYQITAGGMGDVSAIADGRFAYPFPGHTWDTYPGHNGIDISFANCYGEPVYAVADGTVRYTQDGWTAADGVGGMWSFGNAVFVEHGDGWISAYGHLSALAVVPGETVMQGQLVGYIGSTGNSTGPHLHLALYHDGNAGIGSQNFAELAWPKYSEQHS